MRSSAVLFVLLSALALSLAQLVRIEAESGTIVSGAVSVGSDSKASGGSMISVVAEENVYVYWNVTVPADGVYTLFYASLQTDGNKRGFQFFVDEPSQCSPNPHADCYTETGMEDNNPIWKNWNRFEFGVVALKQGVNKIITNGGWGYYQLDYLELLYPNTPTSNTHTSNTPTSNTLTSSTPTSSSSNGVARIEAESGTIVSGDAHVAVKDDASGGYMLDINDNTNDDIYVYWNVTVPAAGDYTFFFSWSQNDGDQKGFHFFFDEPNQCSPRDGGCYYDTGPSSPTLKNWNRFKFGIVTLKEGVNKVFTTGGWGWYRLDYLEFVAPGFVTEESSSEVSSTSASTSAPSTSAPSTAAPTSASTGKPSKTSSSKSSSSSSSTSSSAQSSSSGTSDIVFTAPATTETRGKLEVAGEISEDDAKISIALGLDISEERVKINSITAGTAKRAATSTIDFSILDPEGSSVSSVDLMKKLDSIVKNEPSKLGQLVPTKNLEVVSVNAAVMTSQGNLGPNAAGRFQVSILLVLSSLFLVILA